MKRVVFELETPSIASRKAFCVPKLKPCARYHIHILCRLADRLLRRGLGKANVTQDHDVQVLALGSWVSQRRGVTHVVNIVSS